MQRATSQEDASPVMGATESTLSCLVWVALERGDVADLSPGGLDEGPSAAVGLPPGVVFLSGSCICAGSVIMGIERVKKKES